MAMDHYRQERRDAVTPAMKELGDRVRHYRQLRGWSQPMLAMRALVSAETVRVVEKGESDPSLSVVYAIARALDIPFHELAGAPPSAVDPDIAQIAKLPAEDRDAVVKMAAFLQARRAMVFGIPVDTAVRDILPALGRTAVGGH